MELRTITNADGSTNWTKLDQYFDDCEDYLGFRDYSFSAICKLIGIAECPAVIISCDKYLPDFDLEINDIS